MRRLLVVGAFAVVALVAGKTSFVDVMQREIDQGKQAGWDLLIGELPRARPCIGSTVLLDCSEAAKTLARRPALGQRPGGSCTINWKQSSQPAQNAFTLAVNGVNFNDVRLYNDEGSQYVVYSIWNPLVELTQNSIRVKAPPETNPPTVVKLNCSFTYDLPPSNPVGDHQHEQPVELAKRDNPDLKPDGPHGHVTVTVVSGAEVGRWEAGKWLPLETSVVVDKAWIPGCTPQFTFTWLMEPRCWGNYAKYALWLDDLTFCGKVVDASTVGCRNWHAGPAPGFWVEGTKTGTVGVWGPSYDAIPEVKPCQQPSSS